MRYRRFVTVTAVAALAQLCGCAAERPRDEPLVLGVAIDPVSPITLNTASNAYGVHVKVQATWHAAGNLWHSITAPPAGKYVLVAYEEGYGFVPLRIRTTAENIPRDPDPWWKGFAQGAAPGILAVAIVTAPFWGPVYLATRPKDLPAASYLWMEDADTGAVVAGTSPWVIRDPVTAENDRAQLPRQEGDASERP